MRAEVDRVAPALPCPQQDFQRQPSLRSHRVTGAEAGNLILCPGMPPAGLWCGHPIGFRCRVGGNQLQPNGVLE
jgi:hypothetical protein